MARISRVAVILNRSSGIRREGAPEDAVRTALERAGISRVDIVPLVRKLNVKDVISGYVRDGVDAIIASGGDGTISTVAAELTDSDMPLGVLPTGTLNHFARDLGIPSDLDEAAQVIAAGASLQVDVARVNGRVFINNSSIGIYPAMVTVRDKLIGRGWPKRTAMTAGLAAAFWNFPNTTIGLSTEDTGVVARTPLVFIGNNTYEFSGFAVGTREGLRDGVLQVCTLKNPGRIALLRTLARAVVGSTNGTPELHSSTAERVRIVTLRKRVRVALDGEVVVLRSPLIYTICPKALRVLAPGER